MHPRHFATLAVLCLLLATPAHASGFYIGGGVGSAKLEDGPGNQSGTELDESDTAYKLFGGYRFDWLPFLSLSAEVGYRDLGDPSESHGGVQSEYSADGFDYAALAGLGIGPVELFARVGGMQYDLEKRLGDTRNDFDGTAGVYGVGARFSLFGIGVRAEYESIDIEELDDTRMVSVSAFLQF